MTGPTRNAVFDALLALGAQVKWDGSQSFAETGRRLKSWDQCEQPALFQVDADEDVRSTDGQLDRRVWKANWVIYHNAGKDQAAVPADVSSDIVDAIEAAIRPKLPGARQTLGGLVYRCFIDGRIHKDNGDLDGQGLIIIPISIIVP